MIRTMKVYYSTKDQKHFVSAKPVIHLENRYLAQHGFQVGDAIKVEYNADRIVVTKSNG